MAEAGQEPNWLEVKFKCDHELAEALAEVLGRFAVNGVVIETVTRYNPPTKENLPTSELMVSGYLAVNDQLETQQHRLEEALWHLGQIMPVPEPKYNLVYDQNWMDAWKQHYQPMAIGEKIRIMPAWITPTADDPRIAVRINPAMAFGTGAHPTTQLSLVLLEQHIQPGNVMFDIGCGSGILSIAALKLGAAHVLAVDIDSQAIKSTLENAGLNDISPGVLETGMGSVEEVLTGRFTRRSAPLVMVNILAPVIIRLFDQGLGDLVCKGGKLLLSGILDQQEPDVVAASKKAGFETVERLSDADWISLAMVKNETG